MTEEAIPALAELAERLASLPTHDFVTVLRRAFELHPPYTEGAGEVYVFGVVLRDKDAGSTVEAVAYPLIESSGAEPWEGGACLRCGLELVSTAKVASCPACSAEVHLT